MKSSKEATDFGSWSFVGSNVSGFIAQLVRASHRYREVTGSNPVEILNFSGSSTQLLKLRPCIVSGGEWL